MLLPHGLLLLLLLSGFVGLAFSSFLQDASKPSIKTKNIDFSERLFVFIVITNLKIFGSTIDWDKDTTF
jgi:hypothetical protein